VVISLANAIDGAELRRLCPIYVLIAAKARDAHADNARNRHWLKDLTLGF